MSAPFFPRLGWALALLAASTTVRADGDETETQPPAPPRIDSGEFFFGDDPGVGAATPFTFADPVSGPGDFRSFAFPPPASPGAALVLGVRVRNDQGAWSATRLRHLYLLQTASAPQVESTWSAPAGLPPVTAAPDNGALTLIRPTATESADNAESNAAFGTNPNATPDRLALRPTADGLVGHTAYRQVSALGGRPPARLYHALDTSPDPATAPFVELTDAHRLAPTSVTLDLGNLSPGYHSLHLQVHDTGGSFTETVRFLHVTPSTVQTLAGLAYTFTDAAGNTTPLAVAPITATADAQDIVLTAPAAPVPSEHTLVLHLLDSHLDAGFLASAPLRISTPYHEWVRTALPDRPASATGLLADPDGDRIVNLLEFAFGLDPATKDTTPPYRIRTRETADGAKRFHLVYRQREGGTGAPGVDYTAHGLRYLVETSTDMKTWQPFTEAPGVTSDHTRSSNGDGTETVKLNIFVDQTLTATDTIFVRLTVKLAK